MIIQSRPWDAPPRRVFLNLIYAVLNVIYAILVAASIAWIALIYASGAGQ